MPEPSEPQARQSAQDDLVEALEDATKLLEIAFRDTEGSGYATLLKCKKALASAASQGR